VCRHGNSTTTGGALQTTQHSLTCIAIAMYDIPTPEWSHDWSHDSHDTVHTWKEVQRCNFAL